MCIRSRSSSSSSSPPSSASSSPSSSSPLASPPPPSPPPPSVHSWYTAGSKRGVVEAHQRPSVAAGNGAGYPAVSTPGIPQAPGPLAEEARMDRIEAWIENRIFNCRFLTLLAVVGSLVGATLCFIKGSMYVGESVKVFAYHCVKGINTGKVIMLLVEALDVYLIGTVMLIFGMGLYELFVDTLNLPEDAVASSLLRSRSSSLFGLFPLRARPKWLEIKSLDEMKTKLGHVIVMILLVGMFEKSKKITISTAMDLFLFSGSVALAAVCLYLLSKLHSGGSLDILSSHK